MKAARVDQTWQQFLTLREEVNKTITTKQAEDLRKQYYTQLTTLKVTLNGTLGAIEPQIEALRENSAVTPAGELYDRCRKIDKQILLVQRVLDYYISKYDQRAKGSRYRSVILAADEVVWSCYAGAFQNAKTAYEQGLNPMGDPPLQGPVPLPYIEAHYTPRAIMRVESDAAAKVRADYDDPLMSIYLDALPIPLISLPPVCATDPWLLVLIGHEVGHHLQFDLEPPKALVNSFEKALKQKIASIKPPLSADGNARLWHKWGQEIFADLCSVCAMGPSALRAIIEQELNVNAVMIEDKNDKYPTVVVRVELMTRALQALGMPAALALGDLDPEKILENSGLAPGAVSLGRAKEDLTTASTVAHWAVCEWEAGTAKLPDLFGFKAADYTAGGNLDTARGMLLATNDDPPPKTLPAARSTARWLCSAAIELWCDIAPLPEDARRPQLGALRNRFLELVEKTREPIQRDRVEHRAPDVSKLGKDLADRMAAALEEHSNL